MRKFLVGLLLGIVLVPLGIYLYLCSGFAPVATWAPPMPLERFLATTAMDATIDGQEHPIHLASPTPASLVAGAQIYRSDCAVCHGLPSQAPTAAARGMYPRPPQFFRPNAGKIDDPAREVYWKVKNGIRLTGMPAWRSSLSDTQIRDLTGFLGDASALPSAAMSVLRSPSAKTKPQGQSPTRRLNPMHKPA
ncbi:MAG TPA: c-type cytochrome [Candidatus Dormibacteraeota bacterium]|nr:c-type cytochrome [Candidatus Dormibacteraeota bacterium]